MIYKYPSEVLLHRTYSLGDNKFSPKINVCFCWGSFVLARRTWACGGNGSLARVVTQRYGFESRQVHRAWTIHHLVAKRGGWVWKQKKRILKIRINNVANTKPGCYDAVAQNYL